MWRTAVVVLALALAVPPGRAANEEPPAKPAATKDKQPARVITYRNDKLTIHVQDVPVREVLDEIGRQAGAEIRGELTTPFSVTVDFDDIDMNEGLRRLLRDQNFAIGYGDEERLTSISLLGGPLAPPEKTAGKPAVAAVAEPGAKPYHPKPWPPEDVKPSADRLWGMFTNPKELPVTGRLAEALGTKRATFRQLADAAAHDDDPGVRSRAMLAGLNVINSDPDLRSAFSTTLQSLDDEDVAHLLRQFAGEHAEEWAARLARHSHDDGFRTRLVPLQQVLSTLGPDK
jgi:hypothetical protein